MARVNVYLPDDLAEDARAAGLNVSAITQDALRSELASAQTTAWLKRVRRHRSPKVTHDHVLAALDAVRAEAEDEWPSGDHR
jgi:post-segregation antitoxin (ccd killing protein)